MTHRFLLFCTAKCYRIQLADRRSAVRRTTPRPTGPVPTSPKTCKQLQTPPPQPPAEPAAAPIMPYGLRFTSPVSTALPSPADTLHPLPGPAPTFRPADPALLARVAEICRRPVPFVDSRPLPASGKKGQ
jgi:hypothetical protein